MYAINQPLPINTQPTLMEPQPCHSALPTWSTTTTDCSEAQMTPLSKVCGQGAAGQGERAGQQTGVARTVPGSRRGKQQTQGALPKKGWMLETKIQHSTRPHTCTLLKHKKKQQPPAKLTLETRMEDTAMRMSAVSSITAGVLPAPTPRAGLPEE